jgi:hypothetical protein
MWKDWILKLGAIAKKYGLPTTVRNDTDKGARERPSKFASFVYELQSKLPEECRKHGGSPATVARAINDARRLINPAIPTV